MKIITTKDEVFLDGTGTMMITLNKEGIYIKGMENKENVTLDIRNFYIVYDEDRKTTLEYVTNYLNYNRFQVWCFNVLSWMFK